MMRFVVTQCSICRLSFRVVVRDGDRTAQVERARWAGACHHGKTALEPRMCAHLRRAVSEIEPVAEDGRRRR